MADISDSRLSSKNPQVDAVVIGAGFGGLYQLHLLRAKGLNVRVFEAGGGVGGAWYWNRYPGARTDSPAYLYQYWFSDELLAEWDWSERFPSQAETERYLNHVADRFDLRKDITFNARVTSAIWNESSRRWTVRTESGETVDAQFVVSCTGVVSAPLEAPFPGTESFKGSIFHTARWPREGIDLKGKRVGIVGTGATGIQVIQTIASEVAHLTVFQRTANYTVPIANPKLTDADRAQHRAAYPVIKKTIWDTFIGFDVDQDPRKFEDLSPEDRRKTMEAWYADGSLRIWAAGFKELFTSPAANAEHSEFVREKIRARIKSPALAEKVIPKDHGFGTRRVPLENGYFEALERDNVEIVDIKADPIVALTETGVRTASADYPVDVLILAIGFDASTGTLTRMDVRGRNGISLKEHWSKDLRSTMGLQIHGFPNLFTMAGPFAPAAAFCNVPTCLQQQAKWIADCIAYVRDKSGGAAAIEPGREIEDRWMAHHDELSAMTLIGNTRSWYTGENVAGKKKRVIGYMGVGNYGKACDELKEKGYEGFAIG